MEKLVLLGFCPATIPIITDMGYEIDGYRLFDIVKNIEVEEPKVAYKNTRYEISEYMAGQYNFDTNNHPVQFGVLHSHIKFILYNYFLENHRIEKLRYKSLIHPTCYVSNSVNIGGGFVAEPLSVVSSFSEIGFGVDIKRSCSVGHHAKLHNFVSLNPGVVLSGYVTVGKGTEIGTGATVLNNITIGNNCLIGAGSVVTKDIPDGVVAYGNPCRVVRKNERWEKLKQNNQAT